jgi:hypothetical protein
MTMPVHWLALTCAVSLGSVVAYAAAGPAQKAIIDRYVAQAKAKDPSFTGFSAEAGRAFFFAEQTGGTGEASTCTACHTPDPRKAGQTRAGQAIDPIAVSANPKRFTDSAMVEKWFRRNCDTVLGRECTVMEKGNFLTFMAAQ